jgi:hypothetical protein
MKKQTQFKPNLTQFQSQTNPIVERPIMNAFAWIRNLTIVLIMQLAKFITLKGANFKSEGRRKKWNVFSSLSDL